MTPSKLKTLFGAVLMSAAFASQAASVTTVPLTGMSTDIRTWSDGSAYNALYDSTQVLGGVPFTFAEDASHNTAIYNAAPVTLTTNIANPGTVYTLVNTAFGSLGSDSGSITFNGSGGATFTVHYIQGDNVRDHFYNGFVNSTSSPSVSPAVWGMNAPGNAHLDMQTIVLPDAFHSQTLTSIVFDSTYANTGTGIAFLAGVSVAAVPEPGEYAMLLLGMGLLGAAARRRRA